jgi:hypothetical protein
LELKREEKKEMEVHLSQKAIGLFNAMLRPATAQIPIVGQAVGVAMPYAAKDDAGASQVRTLIRFLELKILRQNKANAGMWEIPEDGVTINLRQTYLDRINEMLLHYKPACLSVFWCESYVELKSGLDGKTLKEDDPEEHPAESAADAKKEAAA